MLWSVLCLAEQQAQQSQALKMFSALLGQQGSGQGQGSGAAEQSAAAAGGASSLEVNSCERDQDV